MRFSVIGGQGSCYIHLLRILLLRFMDLLFTEIVVQLGFMADSTLGMHATVLPVLPQAGRCQSSTECQCSTVLLLLPSWSSGWAFNRQVGNSRL